MITATVLYASGAKFDVVCEKAEVEYGTVHGEIRTLKLIGQQYPAPIWFSVSGVVAVIVSGQSE